MASSSLPQSTGGGYPIRASGLPFGSSGTGTLYRFQTQLPRLPVPPLPQTLKSYLHHLEPLVTPEQFQQAKSDVTKFADSDAAKVLHKYVVDHASHPATENWLHQWWEDSYLTDRASPGVNVSPTLAIEPCRVEAVMKNQCLRAASILRQTILYRQHIMSEKQEPGKFKGKPFCMRDYSYAFNSARIPLLGRDGLVSFPLSTHVVIMVAGRMFYLEAFDLKTGEVKSVQEFLDALTAMKEYALRMNKESTPQGMGALTCGERNQWAAARAELLTSSPKNTKLLRQIEESICVLSLDVDANPKAFSGDQIKCFLSGSHTEASGMPTNEVPYMDRWYDKSFQVHVNAAGNAALTFEHSGQDSLPALYWTNFVTVGEEAVADSLASLVASPTPTTDLQEIMFDPLPEKVVQSRELGLKTVRGVIADLNCFGGRVRDFGSDQIRKKLSCSPDAMLQMIYQVAFHQIRGHIGSTYESCATKTFLRGRTETIRTPTTVSAKFCEEYLANKLSQKELGQLLRASMGEHGRYVKMCLEGQGCDRHLFGLKMAAAELGETLPDFLKSDSHKIWSNILLSTTHPLALSGSAGCSFGPISPDCIGVAYQVFPQHIHMSIMSYKKDEAAKFGQIAKKAVYDFYAMLEATAPPPKKPSKL